MITLDLDSVRDLTFRWMGIMTEGGERLIRLQLDSLATALPGGVCEGEALTPVGDAVSTMWCLPLLYGALFERVTETTRRSFHIVSGMQNELVDLACESLAHSAPAVAEAMSTGNALFADRRHRSVVIHFPERRHLRAWRAS